MKEPSPRELLSLEIGGEVFIFLHAHEGHTRTHVRSGPPELCGSLRLDTIDRSFETTRTIDPPASFAANLSALAHVKDFKNRRSEGRRARNKASSKVESSIYGRSSRPSPCALFPSLSRSFHSFLSLYLSPVRYAHRSLGRKQLKDSSSGIELPANFRERFHRRPARHDANLLIVPDERRETGQSQTRLSPRATIFINTYLCRFLCIVASALAGDRPARSRPLDRTGGFSLDRAHREPRKFARVRFARRRSTTDNRYFLNYSAAFLIRFSARLRRILLTVRDAVAHLANFRVNLS